MERALNAGLPQGHRRVSPGCLGLQRCDLDFENMPVFFFVPVSLWGAAFRKTETVQMGPLDAVRLLTQIPRSSLDNSWTPADRT